jgi:uncharacterized lipoprotein YddW (UPF0748 family)
MKYLIAFLILLLTPTIIFADDPAEMRAVYAATYDVNTQTKCDAIINNMLTNDLNAVFVEVRGRADAYYYPNREDSTYPNTEPRGELYTISPSDLDTLQYFIDRLHNANPPREVHAWCTTYNTWHYSTAPDSPKHVYNAHPEWITKNKDGVTYTYSDDAPLDPGIPAVQDYLYNVFMDIVRNYDVDGIQFDYIRLLGSDSGYNSTALTSFENETGFTYDPASPGELSEVYEAWRRDQLAKLVQRVHTQTKLEKPWVEVSAFLVNFSDSVENLAQGYNWWVAHDAIDALHPGCYSSTVSGTVDDWNFYVNKLKQNGDENKIPMVCAIGDYLLEDPNENADAVIAVRANSRKPDGFNFFDYGSVFMDNSGVHADNLFNPGGPMDDWASPLTPKRPRMKDTTPPNPPANVSAIMGDAPVISFNKPGAASDGDFPVHYRLYRDTSSNVKLYYENMIMEWWDISSSRSSFSFDDVEASPGTYYYSVVSYDDWNNRASAISAPVTITGASEYIIETRSGGKNFGDYDEISGTFFNSSSHSSAPGCTNGIGSRWSRPSDGKNDIARFTPSGVSTDTFDIFVTCFNVSSANAPGITVRVNQNGGIANSTFNLTQSNCGNKWAKVATMNFTSGQGHYIEFDSVTQTTGGSNDRMNPAAVRFVSSNAPAPVEKEKKPAVTIPQSSVTEIIIDSSPQALDYDDKGSWATTSWGTNYNGNARYYGAGSYPMDDYAVWIIDLPRAGNWAIDGYIRSLQGSLAQGVQYRFVDASGTVQNPEATLQTGFGGFTVNVDGVSDDNAYFFNRGRVYITLYGNSTGDQMIIADALRFRLIKAAEVEVPTMWGLY